MSDEEYETPEHITRITHSAADNRKKKHQDYFGSLISKGWNRKEANEATAEASGHSIDEVESDTSSRG